jgi:Protein of unknown function (DUF3984)
MTWCAYEEHPALQLKRSSSTFGLYDSPVKDSWSYRHGAKITQESLEEQGRSWLVSRASSTTDLASYREEEEEEISDQETVREGYPARQLRDAEILDLEREVLDDEDEEDGSDWMIWMTRFLEFDDEDEEELHLHEERTQWRTRRVRVIDPKEGDDANTLRRTQERDEEHGLDGWMDGAASLAFLSVRAFGGLF